MSIPYLVSHVALCPGNLLHDVAKPDFQGVRLLLEKLITLFGTDALGLRVQSNNQRA